jgi:hypothetical protein
MTQKITYSAWSQVPAHLATETTIRKKGLRRQKSQPVVAWIDTTRGKYGGCYALYDLSQCIPKKERSAKQIEAFQRMIEKSVCQRCFDTCVKTDENQLCARCARKLAQEREAQKRATAKVQALFASGFLILDTETTGIGQWDRIVEIALIDDQGMVLMNTLVNPEIPIPKEASAIHGITDEMVSAAPTFSEIQYIVDMGIG